MREDPNDEWLDMMVLTRVTNQERGEGVLSTHL